MLCDAIVCSVIYLFPLRCLFSVDSDTVIDPETVGASVFDYGVDDPTLAAELPGKPLPLITRYCLLFSLLLALE